MARIRHRDVKERARCRDLGEPSQKLVGPHHVLQHVVEEDRVERPRRVVQPLLGHADEDGVVGGARLLGDRRLGLDAHEQLGAGPDRAADAAAAAADVEDAAEPLGQKRDQLRPLLRVVRPLLSGARRA